VDTESGGRCFGEHPVRAPRGPGDIGEPGQRFVAADLVVGKVDDRLHHDPAPRPDDQRGDLVAADLLGTGELLLLRDPVAQQAGNDGHRLQLGTGGGLGGSGVQATQRSVDGAVGQPDRDPAVRADTDVAGDGHRAQQRVRADVGDGGRDRALEHQGAVALRHVDDSALGK